MTNKLLLLLGAFGAFTAGCFGQNLVGLWDLDRDDKISGYDWQPGAKFAYDESPFEDCVNLEMATEVGWSTRSGGSEGTPDYHCFGRFDPVFNPRQCLTWKVTFTGDAMGELTGFNFDIRNYDGTINAFKLAWHASDGTFIGSEEGFFGTSWSDINIDLTGEGLASSFGTEDTYEFRLFAYDRESVNAPKSYEGTAGRIGLDNIRIHGDGVKCIPEPGAVLLGLLSLVPLALRRVR